MGRDNLALGYGKQGSDNLALGYGEEGSDNLTLGYGNQVSDNLTLGYGKQRSDSLTFGYGKQCGDNLSSQVLCPGRVYPPGPHAPGVPFPAGARGHGGGPSPAPLRQQGGLPRSVRRSWPAGHDEQELRLDRHAVRDWGASGNGAGGVPRRSSG